MPIRPQRKPNKPHLSRKPPRHGKGQRAAKGGAVDTGAAALGLILGALAAAFGGKTGGRYPVREAHMVNVKADTWPDERQGGICI